MRTDAQRDHGTLLFAIIFSLLGLWVLWQTAGMSDLGSVFPRTVAIVMILCSLGLIARALLAGKTAAEAGRGQEESMARRAVLVVAMLAWILLLPILGLIVASLLGFLALTVVANYEPWTPRLAGIYVLSALVVVGAFYAVFALGLNVPLPRGSLL
jgi:putative tricarboxylic transport membrane protein